MPSAYDPQAVEAGWYTRWEAAGLFRADADSPRPKYSIALPPPNVTGELHMGHALSGTPQDIWARYRRMTGYEVLWLPGTDHAAISTQNVIERQLAQEGTSKEQLGRAAFEARVELWYASVGATIVDQYRELGASLDLSRLRFTMDPAYVRAVRSAFVHYYDKGWIYRGLRIVNWCPRDLSAISDLEVDWQEHEDTLYEIAYDVEDSGEKVVIATVRPETMLGDTGLAVHPDDDRYRQLVGSFAVLPLVGRRLPIVADASVERTFGTGALKVTPGHDAMDWEIGQRHGLEVVNVLHADATMNVPDLPRYDGQRDLVARRRVLEDLEAEGRLAGTRAYTHQVGHCDRCGAVIQPVVSEQWFLRMDLLARMCVEATERGEVRWHPQRYERTYLDWLGGIRDWCVSRQLWLGHRIPVYTCAGGHEFAAVDEPGACPRCGAGLTQDPDVLDTWFSSALWPFATLGWPDDTLDLRTFYPTAMNATAREIINLWVTRMIFSGLEFMGRVPFSDVAIHCVVQTPDGKRMSKSKGNVVDPREIVDRYGADALRAWAASVAMSSQDVRFDESRIEGYRRFANKLWNATRLVLNGLGEEDVAADPAPDADLGLGDRWILSRLQETVESVTAGIEGYSFQGSITAVYDFVWHDLCDWYLEAAKSRLRDGDPAARSVSLHVLDTALRLLHPFMPFVTDELWHRLPGDRDFLVRTRWPVPDPRFHDAGAVAALDRIRAWIEELRAARAGARAGTRGGRLKLEVDLNPEERRLVADLAAVELVPELDRPATKIALGHVVFPGAAAGASREAGAERLLAELARVEAKLANHEFVTRAPAEVVGRERARAGELRAALERLRPGS